jgi:hypothetical protein
MKGQEFFPVTFISREDIKECFDGVQDKALKQKIDITIDNMSDSDMKKLASKLEDTYLDNGFWSDLRIVFEDCFL